MQHGLAVAAAHHHEVDLLPGQGELHPGDHFRADLIGDAAAGVDQHAIAPVGHVERDILVRDLGAGAAVLVPDVHHLAVLHKGGEALSQAVDLLADAHVHLHPHEGALGSLQGADHGVAEPVANAGEVLALIIIDKGSGVFGDPQLGFAALDGEAALELLHLQGSGFRVQLELGLLFGAAHEVERLGAEDVLLGGGDEHFQHRAAHAPFVLGIGHRVEIHLVREHLHLPDLHAVGALHAGLVHPIAFCEFQDASSFQAGGPFLGPAKWGTFLARAG